jgi:outer membrane protein assembly factor BamB
MIAARVLIGIQVLAGHPASAGNGAVGDWPMWGGRPDRNMVSDAKGLPVQWDVSTRKNLRWMAELGTRTFGNPVVGGGKVFIGTNNGHPRNPAIAGDKGVLMCFAESDGRFLWQALHDKLPEMEVHDWPEIGICSTPCVVGDRVYYVSNRGELVCLDTEGFLDGKNDGPVKDEKLAGRTGADFIWVLDMVKELGVQPFQASASSPLVVGDLVYVVTGNGVDQDKEKVPAPKAPSFIAVNRTTGKVVWADSSPGERIIEGQWSSPAYGQVHGRPQVVFPGGDGWLYAFEPTTGKLIWKFNSNPGKVEAKPGNGQNHLVATPAYYDNKVFVAVGQNPENGKGPGCLWAIDAGKTGDVTSSAGVWQYGGKDFGRSISTVAIRDGLLYAAELRGYLHCLDVATGKLQWKHDLDASAWASPLVADGKVYIINEDGDVTILRQGKQAEVLAKNPMREPVFGTPVAVEGTLYIATQSHLYAIAEASAQTKPVPQASGLPIGGRASLPPSAGEANSTQPVGKMPSPQTMPYPQTKPVAATAPASQVAGKTPAVTAQDWSMSRGNPQVTGVATTSLPTSLQVCWRYAAPDAVESSPAIVAGVVYFGCNDGSLYALALPDGSLKWKYGANSPIKSSPCVYDDAVFFGDDRGTFHAVDARSGKARWTFRTRGQINSSANAVGGRLLFGSYDDYLYCLSARDGALVWKCETEDKIHGTPALAGDDVLVAGCDGQLHIIGISDGTQVGQVAMGSFSGAAPAVVGPRVFLGTFGNKVMCINWAARKIEWSYERPNEQQPFYASAAVTDDLVVIGGRDQLVHALDARTGKPRWTLQTKGQIDASPIIVGDRVFVGSMDGNLYGLDLSSGREVWKFEAGSAIIASPAAAEGRLVAATEDGMVYCFGGKK